MTRQRFTKTGISSRELTKLICRIPLTNLTIYVLAFSARAPVSVLGTSIYVLHETISLALGISSYAFANSYVSRHYDTPHISLQKCPLRNILLIRKQNLASTNTNSEGILTFSPFRATQLRLHLGLD